MQGLRGETKVYSGTLMRGRKGGTGRNECLDDHQLLSGRAVDGLPRAREDRNGIWAGDPFDEMSGARETESAGTLGIETRHGEMETLEDHQDGMSTPETPPPHSRDMIPDEGRLPTDLTRVVPRHPHFQSQRTRTAMDLVEET